jgi:pimeloyl-ACP methyl ester carboxylesterase
MKILLAVLLLLAALPALCAPRQIVVADVPSRPGVTQRVLIATPERALATLVLFAGGERPLGIQKDGSVVWGGPSLLVRSAPLFVDAGFRVAIVDLPSDKLTGPVGDYRESPEHAADIAAVIAYLRRSSHLPLWLAGVGSGATSVLNAAVELQQNGPDGIVFPSGAPEAGPFAARLGEVRVPALVVRKATDLCAEPADVETAAFLARLEHSPRTAQVAVKGRASPDDPCKPAPGHGYLGMERAWVDAIAAWIKPFLKPRQYVLLGAEAGRMEPLPAIQP